VDATLAQDERKAVADGEVVWSWRPDAGVKLCGSIRTATVARKPVHRGEREVSRKPLRREGRDVPAHLWSFPCAFCAQPAAQGAAGASRHPAFPAPSSVWEGHRIAKTRTLRAARSIAHILQLSSPANGSAEWPPDDRLQRAIQYAAASRLKLRRLWNTGSPAFAGDDDAKVV
jgi:hypothetical protein